MDAISEMIELLDGTRLFHDKAVADDEYMNKYYSTKHMLLNRGWLSLVAKHMFPFGLKLMSEIQRIFNVRSIQDRMSECVTAAYESLESDKNLEDEFLASVVDYTQDDEIKKQVYKALLKKTFHGRK